MKRYRIYKMNFQGKAAWFSGIFMGIAVFALALEYLYFRELLEIDALEQIFCLWLPVAACLGYITLIRVIKWNSPGSLALVGALLCLLLIIGCFFERDAIRILLGLLGYGVCGGLLILTAAGFLPGRLSAVVGFSLVIAVRVLLFLGGPLLLQVADFSVLAGLLTLPLAFQTVKKKV